MQNNGDDVRDFKMWHSDGEARSADRVAEPIQGDAKNSGVFVFLGARVREADLDVDRILRDFDRLYPLYEFVESGVQADGAGVQQDFRPNENALVEDLKEIDQKQDVDSTTKKALVAARVGQGRFRTEVLRSWDYCCSVTGSMIQDAIRASHIKPWRDSGNAERLDPNNGLPLIASLDALFDAGLISFDSFGKLIVSSKVSATERDIFGISETTSLRKNPTEKTTEYLAYHRAKYGFKP
jgi:hypothetical protein